MLRIEIQDAIHSMYGSAAWYLTVSCDDVRFWVGKVSRQQSMHHDFTLFIEFPSRNMALDKMIFSHASISTSNTPIATQRPLDLGFE
jgi:hypothetical protein